jgi:hypothetical protein
LDSLTSAVDRQADIIEAFDDLGELEVPRLCRFASG